MTSSLLSMAHHIIVIRVSKTSESMGNLRLRMMQGNPWTGFQLRNSLSEFEFEFDLSRLSLRWLTLSQCHNSNSATTTNPTFSENVIIHILQRYAVYLINDHDVIITEAWLDT